MRPLAPRALRPCPSPNPGQLRILPAPVKALPLCGGLGGDPRTPCSLSGLGITKILAALSTHPPAPPALPAHPGATGARWGGKSRG